MQCLGWTCHPISSKALTCLLQEQGLEDCKPKRAARKAIQRFLALSTEDQRRGSIEVFFSPVEYARQAPFLQSTSCGPLPPSWQSTLILLRSNLFLPANQRTKQTMFFYFEGPLSNTLFQTYVQQSSQLICASSSPHRPRRAHQAYRYQNRPVPIQHSSINRSLPAPNPSPSLRLLSNLAS